MSDGIPGDGEPEKTSEAAGRAHERLVKLPMPRGMNRPETGPMQFGDDWPGVFIRGNNALAYAYNIRMLANDLERRLPESQIEIMQLRDLANDLFSCRAT